MEKMIVNLNLHFKELTQKVNYLKDSTTDMLIIIVFIIMRLVDNNNN